MNDDMSRENRLFLRRVMSRLRSGFTGKITLHCSQGEIQRLDRENVARRKDLPFDDERTGT